MSDDESEELANAILDRLAESRLILWKEEDEEDVIQVIADQIKLWLRED